MSLSGSEPATCVVAYPLAHDGAISSGSPEETYEAAQGMGRYEITEEQREQALITGKLALTPEQQELAFADEFVKMAFDYGLQYYGMARFGMASAFMPAGATVLHHAIEMFLQGCLALKDTPAQIRKYYHTYHSHGLLSLWADLTPRYPDAGLAEFDSAILALEKFSGIRFPQRLAGKGGMMQVGFAEPPAPPRPSERDFMLDARPLDKLVVKLFEVADFNPAAFGWLLKHKHAEPYFVLYNEHPLIR
jgi:hypothetical protein